MPETPPLKRFSTEYVFSRTWSDGSKHAVWITRHSNHGTWIEEGGWVVMIVLGPLNPWYLAGDGHWRYKYGHRFESAEAAYDHLARSHSPKQTREVGADATVPEADKA